MPIFTFVLCEYLQTFYLLEIIQYEKEGVGET